MEWPRYFERAARVIKTFKARLVPARTLERQKLRRTRPVSRIFGLDRGKPIDRYYIEQFLTRERECVRGKVLEIGENVYTVKYGAQRVTHSEVLHAVAGNSQATLVGDLVSGRGIPENAFDCLILTQTLQFIYSVNDAVKTSYRALVPGGVLLATIPGISQISRYDMRRWGEFWRFTDAAARKFFGEVFGSANVFVETKGNVLSACALLQGMACHELTREELDYQDDDYQVVVFIKAIKQSGNE